MVVTAVTSTLVIAQNVMLIIDFIGSFLTGFKIGQVGLFRYSKRLAEETSQGAFHTVYKLDGKCIPAEEVNEELGKEKVICVKRCCCSLTGWFPSGVFTPFTWLLAGTAVRHEFILLHTINYVILIEIGLNGKKNSMTSILIKSASSNTEKKEAEKELLQEKSWVRTMKEFKGINLENLQFYQITFLIGLWILIARAGGCNYTVIQKNCKSLARSILYFSKNSTNYWDVLYSLWGIFSDKPFYVFHHPEIILIEKSAFIGFYYGSKRLKRLAEDTIDLLEKIRNHQLVEENSEISQITEEDSEISQIEIIDLNQTI